MTYPAWLAVLSLGVAVLERCTPARPAQRALRRSLVWDGLYLVFNGHFLCVALAVVYARLIEPALLGAGVVPALHRAWASGWPLWLQVVVALVGLDLVQWGVHRLLHAVPWLWRFHRVHHSVADGEMDWIVSFRFHWMEAVIYKVVQYVPLTLLGFSPPALLLVAVLSNG